MLLFPCISLSMLILRMIRMNPSIMLNRPLKLTLIHRLHSCHLSWMIMILLLMRTNIFLALHWIYQILNLTLISMLTMLVILTMLTTRTHAPVSLPLSVNNPPFPLLAAKVQRRTSIQEGDNVIVDRISKHKQPIEVEYNLPFRYNPNKRKFKPQLLTKRRKKTRLNMISTRLVPWSKVRHIQFVRIQYSIRSSPLITSCFIYNSIDLFSVE
ncbi:hypothetical protein EDC96DRAFT_585509 [Choanephora cucurbitarum]|nr:hypothetical protein EDC96DRAFT_585509 [Choanephora cucurbitarum]